MRNPLSIFTYYIRNARKVVPVMLIIAFSILGVTATAAIGGSFLRDVGKFNSLYDIYYTVRFQPNEAKQYSLKEVEQNLDKLKNSEYYIKGKVLSTYSTTMTGTMSQYIFYFGPIDDLEFMKQVGWTLEEGKLPSAGSNELALSHKLMVNKDLRVGSRFGVNLDRTEILPGTHMVSGRLKQSTNVSGGLGKLDNLANSSDDNYTFFIKPTAGANAALRAELIQIEKDFPGVEIRTDQTEREFLDKIYQIVNQLVWSLDILIMLVICMCIGLLNIIYFMQRASEFGVLNALGYSKNFLLRKTFLESVGLIFTAWIFGLVLTQVVYSLLNFMVFHPRGIEGLTILEPGTFIFSLPVPITVSVFSLGTIYWHFSSMDAVAIIEKRD
jgi:ABC-type antimicrobial peptide transport system permease subunit